MRQRGPMAVVEVATAAPGGRKDEAKGETPIVRRREIKMVNRR